ncbi:hypothetical protein AB0M36_08095 [Actinoplanes sp. NPDC051346]|uniref:hypothetical protein n=1 Tax=Actinoplanes sp. NPDC051346 TaxID=3155048 RepID=UPI003445498C
MDTAVTGAEPPAAPLAGSAFIDLVCHDEQLLRAEFDELIAASWQTPPGPPPPASPQRSAPAAGHSFAPVIEAERRLTHREPDNGWRHQRSPP